MIKLEDGLPSVASQPFTSPVGSRGPSNFDLFGTLTKHLAGKPFTTDTDVKEAVTSWLRTFDIDFFYAGYQPWCQGGTNAKFSILITWWSDMYYLLPICQVYIKVRIKRKTTQNHRILFAHATRGVFMQHNTKIQ